MDIYLGKLCINIIRKKFNYLNGSNFEEIGIMENKVSKKTNKTYYKNFNKLIKNKYIVFIFKIF